MTKFELAKKSAEFASMLDDEKNTLQPFDKSIAQWLVNQIHLFAENIAGNRSNEIYCPDDMQTTVAEIAKLEEELRLHDAARRCTCNQDPELLRTHAMGSRRLGMLLCLLSSAMVLSFIFYLVIL